MFVVRMGHRHNMVRKSVANMEALGHSDLSRSDTTIFNSKDKDALASSPPSDPALFKRSSSHSLSPNIVRSSSGEGVPGSDGNKETRSSTPTKIRLNLADHELSRSSPVNSVRHCRLSSYLFVLHILTSYFH